MNSIKLIFAVFIIGTSIVLSQEKPSQNVDYIVIDLSNSHPTNRTLDHLHYLNINSFNVELPSEIIEFLGSIDDGNDPRIHNKYTYQRSEILRVLYNERISPEDKLFLCNHYLSVDSDGVRPIHTILQKYIDNGDL